MKINKVLPIMALVVLSFGFGACSDDKPDITKPTIVIHAPENETHFMQGARIHFKADLTDDNELKHYKIDIHSAEGHSHSTGKQLKTGNVWTFVRTYDIAGVKHQEVNEYIDIPEDAPAGDYHLVVYGTDITGNEATANVTFEVVEN